MSARYIRRDTCLRQLRELVATSEEDRERAHEQADQALLDYIHDAEIAAAYDAIEKWDA